MTPVHPRPTALITGGTTGIGRATARLLHEQGFAVVVTGQNPETLAEAKRTLPEGVVVRRADARVIGDTDVLAAEMKDRFGRLDLLFLNAGVGRLAPIEAIDDAFFDEHLEVNVKGQLFTLQRMLPLFRTGGSVIFSAALATQLGLANWSVYSATKGAVLALVNSLAVELAPLGIRVNAVTPGPIDNPGLAKVGLPEDALDGFKAATAQRIPLGRMGSDEEVARTVAFLASPSATYITGANLVVDGGMAVSL